MDISFVWSEIMKKPKKLGLFSKISSRDDAIKIIKDSAMAFIVVGILNGAIGFWLMPSMVIDAIIYIVLGFLLRRFYSRVVALILLLLSGASIFVTFMNLTAAQKQGGTNVVLAVIVFIAAVRAVEATVKLRDKFKLEDDLTAEREISS
jgi:hypothetical protein